MKQAYVRITGVVHGVGFRQFIKKNAQKKNITGWVKNLSDGSVAALFSGETETITDMITLCKKGPFLSEVDNVVITWEESENPPLSFEIQHD